MTDTHRAYFARRLALIAENLDQMLNHWVDNDLPADYLSGEEFPFDRSLEDMAADVRASANRVEEGPEDQPRFYAIGIPIAITVHPDRVEFDVDLSEVSDIYEDDDAFGRYGDERVEADRAIVSKAADTVGNHFSFTTSTQEV